MGIDVSKGTLDIFQLPQGKGRQVSNTPEGIQELLNGIKPNPVDLVVLEATGGYQNLLVEALHANAIPVKVANPRQVRDFARSLNRLGKTDALDAKTIAEYGLSRELRPDVPRTALQMQLSRLLLRRDQLQTMITIEKGHREHAHKSFVAGIQEHLTLMDGLLKAADKEIREIIRSIPEYARADQIMQSVPGVGPVVSATILAELPELTLTGRKQAAALVGVAPFNRDSGKYRGRRHIYAGRCKVRTTMYCAMRACLRWNPVIKEWFDKFISAGKPYKVAAVACVRKLLIVLRAMLINNTTWAPRDSHYA